MTEPLVQLRHVRMIRRAGGRPLCASGIRAWCARHGFSMTELEGPGLPGDAVAATGDYWALQALDNARAEASGG